jgi:hypothetical protein
MAWLSCGGYWRDKPRGWGDQWIERRTAEGRHEWAVARLARAAQEGGCTTAEAFGVLRDFDCIHLGTACEAWNFDDLPQDRWFRNAWRRSHNGGPIYIAMTQARKIQLARMKNAAATAKAELQWGRWKQKARSAETPQELRMVWPKGLMHG